MNEKKISIALVALSSITAFYFVIKQNFEMAILFLTIMFTFTNFFRARSFKADGYVKESKWMKAMSIFFGISSILILIIVLN